MKMYFQLNSWDFSRLTKALFSLLALFWPRQSLKNSWSDFVFFCAFCCIPLPQRFVFLEVSLKKKISFNGDFHEISTYNMVISPHKSHWLLQWNTHSVIRWGPPQKFPTTVRSVSVRTGSLESVRFQEEKMRKTKIRLLRAWLKHRFPLRRP